MQIPTSEMLSLLPDSESFLAGRRAYKGGRLIRNALSLEDVSNLASSQNVTLIVKRKGFGYAARFGHVYLKLDRKRVLAAGYISDDMKRRATK
jgi:hypothetical protein